MENLKFYISLAVVSKGSKLDVLSGFGENSTCNSNGNVDYY